MADLAPSLGADNAERLEGEVERLKSQIAELTGEAELREREALRTLLRAVREAQSEMRPDWQDYLLRIGAMIAGRAREEMTVEEFTAAMAAKRVASKEGDA